MPAWRDDLVTHHHADVGAVRLHYVTAGSGPLVLLLHGFPESWYAWRNQIPALVDAGYRVVAPDLRGYNRSDKPRGVGAYRIEHLVGDVVGLIDALGEERAHVVGHDWGGALTWALGGLAPDRVRRLAVLNCPHPARLLQGFRTLRQLRRSWYMFFFQLPVVPERLLLQDDCARLREMLRDDAGLSPDDIDRYVAACRRPGALTGGMNWYRAAFRRDVFARRRLLRPVDAPVRVIWGERDRVLGPELADPGPRWAPNREVVRIPDASHWVQWDASDRVNALLVEWLGGGG